MNFLVLCNPVSRALGRSRRQDFLVFALCILFVVMAGAGTARAQGTNLTWHWSNPTPFGNSITDLAWRTNRLYLAVGDRGSLWVADSLPNWRRAKTGTTVALRGATYLGDRAIVVGEGDHFLVGWRGFRGGCHRPDPMAGKCGRVG